MKWIRKIYLILFNVIQVRLNRYKVIEADDLPDDVSNKEIIVGGGLTKSWVVLLKCPCGCNSLIYLNTLKEEHPSWEVVMNLSGISIYPSVWRTKGCKSHFWVKAGKIIWA
jgi:hypothetical protein